jgi:transcriptional regulator with XRE-family HTH domain
MSQKMEVAELVSARTGMKMNRTDLARELGIHPSSVDQWETGKRKIPNEQAAKIRILYNHRTAAPTEFVQSSMELRGVARRLIEAPYEDPPKPVKVEPIKYELGFQMVIFVLFCIGMACSCGLGAYRAFGDNDWISFVDRILGGIGWSVGAFSSSCLCLLPGLRGSCASKLPPSR